MRKIFLLDINPLPADEMEIWNLSKSAKFGESFYSLCGARSYVLVIFSRNEETGWFWFPHLGLNWKIDFNSFEEGMERKMFILANIENWFFSNLRRLLGGGLRKGGGRNWQKRENYGRFPASMSMLGYIMLFTAKISFNQL